MVLTKFFQINPFIAFYRNQIIIPFLIIPKKQIFWFSFGIGQFYRICFFHIEYSLVFRFFIEDILFFQILTCFFFVHCHPLFD